MTFVQIIIAFLIAYLCVYALINRVCQCIEHCATARAYSKSRESGMSLKMDDVEAGIKKSNKEKENIKEIFQETSEEPCNSGSSFCKKKMEGS